MGRFDALTQLEEPPVPVKKKVPVGVTVKEQSASPPLPEKPDRQDKPDKADKQAGTSSPVAHAPPNNRPVKLRHGFDIYWDQYEALVQFSNEEKLHGGTGSMSAMVRQALDDYLAKRKKQ